MSKLLRLLLCNEYINYGNDFTSNHLKREQNMADFQ